jgi:hypothetical protein
VDPQNGPADLVGQDSITRTHRQGYFALRLAYRLIGHTDQPHSIAGYDGQADFTGDPLLIRYVPERYDPSPQLSPESYTAWPWSAVG